MKAPFEDRDPEADEREIRSLSDRSGVGLVQVRTLFRKELARVGMGAKVSSYLAVLTASNVRGMLGRTTRLAEAVQVQERNAERLGKRELQRRLHSWEDDGGRVRRAS